MPAGRAAVANPSARLDRLLAPRAQGLARAIAAEGAPAVEAVIRNAVARVLAGTLQLAELQRVLDLLAAAATPATAALRERLAAVAGCCPRHVLPDLRPWLQAWLDATGAPPPAC
ncbi:hypothetical protein [Thermomonas flagellata]|uniref:hypothetical protein n=1 Tax=Thermomonas flagellata TaxID=2888524 RepID=UPI001F040E54|nr:hypothetical protein [Thermomonas flagellata]